MQYLSYQSAICVPLCISKKEGRGRREGERKRERKRKREKKEKESMRERERDRGQLEKPMKPMKQITGICLLIPNSYLGTDQTPVKVSYTCYHDGVSQKGINHHHGVKTQKYSLRKYISKRNNFL